ncbi:polyphosphate:AMP phosphotransferase [bacterium]|nr:polyphosphate:AMP phosphotransferase [bacterium]
MGEILASFHLGDNCRAMLETIDPTRKVDKEAYRLWFPRLKTDLRELQQKVREVRMPVIVIIEGWFFSGRGDTIKHLGEALDPRGFTVYAPSETSTEEARRPWMWRHWVRIPARGKIAFFEHSWYQRVLDERVLGAMRKSQWAHAFQEINQTEEMLAADGYQIVKFWLHISEKEQRHRLKKMQKDPFFEVTPQDRKMVARYHEFAEAAEEMLERTSTHVAPWTIVEADDHRYRRMKIFQTICELLANGVTQRQQRKRAPKADRPASRVSVPALEEMPTLLDNVDLNKTVPPEVYEEKKVTLQLKLRRLHDESIKRDLTKVIVMEGWDASGKGGSIRRLTATLDPRHYNVIPIGKPTQEELDHHYLWRFWTMIPQRGQMTIFDRSWYGRVLVERIEGFCSEDDWRRAYQEINEFELQLYNAGITLIKFWLHITPEEQLRRFKAREADPNKVHKLTEEDWRNREKWGQYRECVDDMITRTSTTYAPWTLIEADCKRHARLRVMETVSGAIEKGIQRQKKT